MMHVYFAYIKLALLKQIHYQAELLIWLIGCVLEPLLYLIIWSAVADANAGSVDTFTAGDFAAYFIAEMLVNYATYTAVMWEYEYRVRNGVLSAMLLRPLHPIHADLAETLANKLLNFLVILPTAVLWELADMILGLVVLSVVLPHLGTVMSFGQITAFVVTLVAGGIILYSFWLMLATCAFWFVRVESMLAIFQNMYQAGRWPISIYPSWLRWLLTVLIPVGLVTTIPTEALVGGLSWEMVIGIVGLGVGMLVVSRMFWRVGVRYYTGASA